MATRSSEHRVTRLDSLTGLRFLAALAVFGLHLVVFFPTYPYTKLDRLVTQGGTGVSFFFILSGFVLTWSHRAGDNPAAFFRRRVARIVPSHIVMWVVAGLVLIAVSQRPSPAQALSSLWLVSPWIPNVHTIESMNVPAWSLGCEMFFYAVFPALLPILAKRTSGQRRLLVMVLIGVIALVAIGTAPATYPTRRYWALYFFPPSRLPEFLIGMLLALEVGDRRLGRIPLAPAAAFAAAAYLACGWIAWPYSVVLITVVPFSVLIVAAAQHDDAGLTTGFLSSRAMVRLGVWSYAFYLVHWPLMLALAHLLPFRRSTAESLVLAPAILILMVLAAGLLHTVVEAPAERALRGPRGWRPPRRWWAGMRKPVAGLAALASVLGIASAASAMVYRSGGGTAAVASGSLLRNPSALTPATVAVPRTSTRRTGRPQAPALGIPGAAHPAPETPPTTVRSPETQSVKQTNRLAPSTTVTTAPVRGPVPVSEQICTGGNLAISVSTARSIYLPGQPVTITVSARNKSTSACQLQTPPCYPSVSITNSDGSVVAMLDGSPAGGSCNSIPRVDLVPGQSRSTAVTWNQTVCSLQPIAAGCSGSSVPPSAATPGQYAAIGNWMSQPSTIGTTTFLIS